MKVWKAVLLCVFVLLLLSSGCMGRSTVYLEQQMTGEEVRLAMENTEQESGTESNVDTRDKEQNMQTSPEENYFIYICGAVVSPGVYSVPAGSRVYEIILLADGLLENASGDSVNQARELVDGEMIVIPTREEAGAIASSGGGMNTGTTEAADTRVDINTATAEALMTLPGIGQSKADSIIAYREENGAFSCIEDIQKVPGIKAGIYEKMKARIKVN